MSLTIGILALFAIETAADATIITVTNTNDSGPGSLRQALADVIDRDRIEFAVTGTIALSSAELLIDKSITITGPGADLLTVSQSLNTQFRVFHVMPGIRVGIQGLTISDGHVADDVGGGILNDQAVLTLSNCSVLNNVAHGGGGVYTSDGGSLTIVSSVINGNSAIGGNDPYGGGIASGSLTIINSIISGNSAVGDFPFTFGYGGGISGNGTITNTTINGNYSGAQAGGMGFAGTIANSTISGNSAFGDDFKGPGVDGGMETFGTVAINNCTFSDNYVNFGNGDTIYNGGTLEIGNTILKNAAGFSGGTSLTTEEQLLRRVIILVAMTAVAI